MAHYELVVVGAGAGGVGAALTAARAGVATLLVESGPTVGGNAVLAGVSVWEPGVGGLGLPHEIYTLLAARPRAVGIYSIGRHMCFAPPGVRPYPGGEIVLDPARQYRDTLQRHGLRGLTDEGAARQQLHGVPFEPAEYVAVVEQLLADAGCELWRDTALTGVETATGRVTALRCTGTGGERRVTADVYCDATGDVELCAAAGCDLRLGSDGQGVYGEPDAPPESTSELNGVTLVYRVAPAAAAALEPPGDLPERCWWQPEFPVAQITALPGGDWHVNMLPTMEGSEHRTLGREAAEAECRRRVWAHWRWTQARWPEFADHHVVWIAPRLGVREGPRVVTDYVLTEHDLLAGLSAQPHDDIVALADHAMDTHGNVHGRGCGEVAEPYGIPFRCLLPRGWDNLLVACRGAGFSHIAASSCRLTRTMMTLGQAAGAAVALARDLGCAPRDVPAATLRQRLSEQGVGLTIAAAMGRTEPDGG